MNKKVKGIFYFKIYYKIISFWAHLCVESKNKN